MDFRDGSRKKHTCPQTVKNTVRLHRFDLIQRQVRLEFQPFVNVWETLGGSWKRSKNVWTWCACGGHWVNLTDFSSISEAQPWWTPFLSRHISASTVHPHPSGDDQPHTILVSLCPLPMVTLTKEWSRNQKAKRALLIFWCSFDHAWSFCKAKALPACCHFFISMLASSTVCRTSNAFADRTESPYLFNVRL